jgi:hypothetical protein
MKTFRVLVSFVLLLSFGLFVSPATADTTPTLTKNGITLSFPKPVYEIASSTSVSANFTNNSGLELFALGYQVTDRFGSVIVFNSPEAYKVANGASGTIVRTWYAYEFVKAVAPLTITMIAQYGYNSGKSDELVSVPFEFVPRVAVMPTPAPTVTVTVTPAPKEAELLVQISELKLRLERSEATVKSLQTVMGKATQKLAKICSAKPKPKGC